MENEREINVLILIHTDSENESEKMNENKTTSSGLINNDDHISGEMSVYNKSKMKMTKIQPVKNKSRKEVYQ